MKTFIFVFAVLIAASSIFSASEAASGFARKQLAGPPSEFGLHRLPTPLAGAVAEGSAMFEANLSQHPLYSTRVAYTQALVVDSSEAFAFCVVSPHEDLLTVTLTDPQGNNIPLASYATKGIFPIGQKEVPTTVYYFKNPVVGTYQVSFNSQDLSTEKVSQILSSTTKNIAVLLWNKSNMKIYTHLNTYNLHTGSGVGLVTTVTKDSVFYEGIRAETDASSEVLSAQLDIILPDGAEVDVAMHDDGLHSDLLGNDGVYGASIIAQAPGDYKAKAILTGKHSDGTPFVRTTQHLLSVISKTLSLENVALGEFTDNHNKLQINVQVTPSADFPKGEEEQPLYRAFAEVHGHDSTGAEVPVCWIGGLVNVDTTTNTVSLTLDLRWATLAKAQEPFVLKNVYLQDSISQVPVASIDQIVVKTSGSVSEHVAKHAIVAPSVITKDMKQGVNPLARRNTTAAEKKGLVLLHGYCSTDNPWEVETNGWTDPFYFLNPSSSIGNEEFAQKVLDFVEQNGLTAFSLIGHSQGGMVSAHILNYYFTGMDNSEDSSKRLIQSVGTPYQGCSAAGSLASIGTTFGVGCGSNFDLSVDGAKLWLSGVTSDTRQQVHYYTSTYQQGNFFGDYCSMPMNMVLQWPNDGVSELAYTTLEGANYQGNTEKQCHTVDMAYSAQYLDTNRNKKMNTAAAR